MKQILQFIFGGVCLVIPLAAQNSGLQYPQQNRIDRLIQESTLRAMEHAPAQEERQIAERRHAQFLEQQFVARMNGLMAIWTSLAQEYNTKKVFNIKRARELTKAFHDLEDTEGWPKTRK